MSKKFYTWLWRAEYIPLGRFAPYVLGKMVGSKGKRIK